MARHRNSRRRNWTFERLEDRRVMAANLYIDFGFEWETTPTFVSVGTADVESQDFFPLKSDGIIRESLLDTPELNGPRRNDVPDHGLKPTHQHLMDIGLDYNGDGESNGWDASAIAADTLAVVRSIFAPFNVNVIPTHARTLDDVADTLAQSATNDAYILIGAPALGEGGGSGLALLDLGNTQDNVGLAYASSYLSSKEHPTDLLDPVGEIYALAACIAHEAGHTFGLHHTGLGENSNSPMLSGGDLMSYFHDAGAGFVRFPLDIDHDWVTGLQNAYETLAETVGVRPDAPAYVTGTGAHDKITITATGFAAAQVTVEPYNDPSYGADHLIAPSISYMIDTAYGVVVDGFSGDDYIEINIGNGPATIRGNGGDDTLIGGNGPDRLIGGPGNDQLLGGPGHDTYVFEKSLDYDPINYEFYPLGHDTITDRGGSDTLDFSQLGRGITIDLAVTAAQRIDTPPSFFETTIGGVEDAGPYLELSFGTLPYIKPSAFLIENVIGTPGNDAIRGNAAANRLEGRGGKDVLEGRGGNDDLIGGAGDDTYVFSGSWLGSDTIRESSGHGTDALDFRGFAYGVNIDLANRAWQTVQSNHLSLLLETRGDASTQPFIENVQGSEYADTIRGNSRDNALAGNGGNDLLFGQDGLDWLLGGNGIDELDGGNDSYADRLEGGAGGDIFYYWPGKTNDDLIDFSLRGGDQWIARSTKG